MSGKMLSQSIAETILSIITIEKRFAAGDRLPGEKCYAGTGNRIEVLERTYEIGKSFF